MTAPGKSCENRYLKAFTLFLCMKSKTSVTCDYLYNYALIRMYFAIWSIYAFSAKKCVSSMHYKTFSHKHIPLTLVFIRIKETVFLIAVCWHHNKLFLSTPQKTSKWWHSWWMPYCCQKCEHHLSHVFSKLHVMPVYVLHFRCRLPVVMIMGPSQGTNCVHSASMGQCSAQSLYKQDNVWAFCPHVK